MEDFNDKCEKVLQVLLKEDETGCKMVDYERYLGLMQGRYRVSEEDAGKYIAIQKIKKRVTLEFVGARCYICFT